MREHFKRLARAAACATIVLLAPSAGQAAILLPGGTVTFTAADILVDPVNPLFDVEGSVIRALTGDSPGGELFYTGTLAAAVVRNSAGTLDFYYQVSNDATSIDSLTRETNASFRSATLPPTIFATEVFYRTDDANLGAFGFTTGDAGATPRTADRTTNGRVVGFNFVALAPGAEIDPGDTSMILVVRTNALTFMNGTSSVINGATDSVATFQPLSAVPEPASLLLLSSAFGAASYMARHRVKRRKPTSA